MKTWMYMEWAQWYMIFKPMTIRTERVMFHLPEENFSVVKQLKHVKQF